MAVPSSGELCLAGIAKEKYYNSYTYPSWPPIDIKDKGYELNNMAVGTQFGTINTGSASYPDGIAPYCMSEWYDYDHDAAALPAWSTMAATTTSTNCWVSSAGTVPAAMVSQGASFTSPYPAQCCTQEFNGTSWSSAGNNTSCRKGNNNSAIGTQNAALAFGGQVTSTACPQTSEYNGSTWANSNNVPHGITLSATGGTQNSAIFAGGRTPVDSTCVREYNGSTWSSATGLPGGQRYGSTGVGTQNAFLITGGTCGYAVCVATREYNGSSWSTGPSLPTKRYLAAGAGNQNDAKVAGGCYCLFGPIQSCNTVEDYNGTTWSTGTSLPDCRTSMASGGTTTCMWAVGGCKYQSGFCKDGYIWD